MNAPILEYLPRFPEDDDVLSVGWLDKSEPGIPGVRIFTRGASTVILIRGVSMWDFLHTCNGEVEHALLHPEEVTAALRDLANRPRTSD